jgi:hypothetical protein
MIRAVDESQLQYPLLRAYFISYDPVIASQENTAQTIPLREEMMWGLGFFRLSETLVLYEMNEEGSWSIFLLSGFEIMFLT